MDYKPDVNRPLYFFDEIYNIVKDKEQTKTQKVKWTIFRQVLHKDWKSLAFDILDSNYDLFMALYDTINCGKFSLLEQLLDRVTDNTIVNRKNEQEQTLIHALCLYSGSTTTWDTKILTRLSKFDIDFSTPDSLMNYPIHYACQNGHLGIVKFYLDRQLSFDVVDSNGMSPLALAASGNTEYHFEIVKLFLENGSDPNEIIKTNENEQCPLLIHAVKTNKSKLVDILLSAGKNINANALDGQNNTALIIAVTEQNVTIISSLLSNSADPNIAQVISPKLTPLMIAIRHNNIEIVKLLCIAKIGVYT